jgi:hypothetical protein
MVMPFWPVLMEYTAPLNFSSLITVLKFQEFVSPSWLRVAMGNINAL